MEIWSQSHNYHFPQNNHFARSQWNQSPKTEPEPFQTGVLSASDALQKIQRKNRPRIRNRKRPISRMSAQASSSHGTSSKSEAEKPQVVFFPTSQDENSDPAKCQDADAQGNGFNAFAFLSFLVSVFNAVR